MISRGRNWVRTSLLLACVLAGASPFEEAGACPEPRLLHAADVAPYFSTGKLAKAKAEFDRGQYPRAAELLAKEGDAHPVRYLRALARLNAGEHTDAAVELIDLSARYPQVREDALFHAATGLEKAGAFADAAELFMQISPDSHRFDDSRFGLARVYLRLGEARAAQVAIAPLTDDGSRFTALRAWVALAEAHRAAGEKELERAALLEVWAREPLSSEAKAAARRLGPRGPTLEAKVARAEALVELHHLNKKALDELEPLWPKLALPEPVACRAHFVAGKALRKERRHVEAIARLGPVTRRCFDPVLRPRALYTLAYSQSVVAKDEAIGTYETLAADYPDHSFADDALVQAAELALLAGDASRALSTHTLVSSAFWTGDFAGEATFRAFWIHRSRGELREGLERLDEIIALQGLTSRDEQVDRARYWRGRVQEQLGDATAAAASWERLAVDRPGNYYGFLARERLARLSPSRAKQVLDLPFAPTAPEELWPIDAGPLAKNVRFHSGLELLRLGLPGASSELLAIDRSTLPDESVRLLFQALYDAGLESGARLLARDYMRRLSPDPRHPKLRPMWELAYPRPYRGLVESSSKVAGVDPDLLQALMREESGFRTTVRSPTGALGLTQLMPSTARAVAKGLRMKVSEASLLRPDANIRIGSTYLSSLHRQHGGNRALAVASYNAGPGAVARWLRTRPNVDLDEFVEQIPIDETRDYVRRVLGSYDAYASLNARATAATLPIALVSASR